MNRSGVGTATHDVVAGLGGRDASEGEDDAAGDEVGEERDGQNAAEDDAVDVVQLHLVPLSSCLLRLSVTCYIGIFTYICKKKLGYFKIQTICYLFVD